MNTIVPWRFGAALALTVLIGYTGCTILWVAFTEQGIDFLNALFHGLDFRKIAAGTGFSFAGWIYSVVVLGIWAFLIGALFAVVGNRVSAERARA